LGLRPVRQADLVVVLAIKGAPKSCGRAGARVETGSYLTVEVDESKDGIAHDDVEATRQSALVEHAHVDAGADAASAKPAPVEARSSMEMIDAQLGMSAQPRCASAAARRCTAPATATSAGAAAHQRLQLTLVRLPRRRWRRGTTAGGSSQPVSD